MDVATAVKFWSPFAILGNRDKTLTSESSSNDQIALLILNHSTSCEQSFEKLWGKSVINIAVDGGVNILYRNCLSSNCLSKHIPDIICGDFDSANQDIVNYYKQKGVEIVPTPDQNSTDFTKAIVLCLKRLEDKQQHVKAIMTLSSLGERLDHVFANVNTLYLAEQLTTLPIYLVSDFGITWLLHPGEHSIEIPINLLKSNCGLIPVGEPCLDVTTTGLKWNLKNRPLKFGEMVSTSNTFTDTTVTIQTDKHLLFTMER